MKKLIFASLIITASSTAMAASPGGPNCGWGNMLFEGKSGLGSHMLALTTNGTSGNATFGMTFGTNGCATDGSLSYGGDAMVYNLMDELIEDVARGHGEALNAVASLLGVEKDDRSVFAKVSHENFDNIFPHENVTAKEVVASLKEMMRENNQLSKYSA